jgi:hypothetical protein
VRADRRGDTPGLGSCRPPPHATPSLAWLLPSH